MNNQEVVQLRMPPILPRTQKLPAAFMYFGFFAVGVISGTVLTAGKKGGSGSSKPKSD